MVVRDHRRGTIVLMLGHVIFKMVAYFYVWSHPTEVLAVSLEISG